MFIFCITTFLRTLALVVVTSFIFQSPLKYITVVLCITVMYHGFYFTVFYHHVYSILSTGSKVKIFDTRSGLTSEANADTFCHDANNIQGGP